MTHQFQPTRRSCGQTCLAMLCARPATEVIAEIPDKKGTHVHQLVAYLRKRGWSVPDRTTRFRGELPDLAILRIIWEERSHRTHWAVWYGDKVLDPAYGVVPLEFFPNIDGRVMTFLPLVRP